MVFRRLSALCSVPSYGISSKGARRSADDGLHADARSMHSLAPAGKPVSFSHSKLSLFGEKNIRQAAGLITTVGAQNRFWMCA